MGKNKAFKAPKAKFDKVYFKRYYQLYLLLALPLIYLLIFKYVPMWYILIAFKKYSIVLPVHKMAWAKHNGMEFFIKAFKSKDFLVALRNTIMLNLKDLIVGFPVPIIFALILNELRVKRFKKVVQTITYMPHFLSWVVIYGLALQLFAPSTGLVNLFVEKLGGNSINFLGEPGNWVRTYIGLGIWQSFGWNSIIYLAAIAGISPDLYEAASVDGASRFQKMWHITLPGIRSTIIVLLIMALGNIIGSGFDRPFAMANPTVLEKAEVIATYVYKAGIKGSQFSLTAAVGLFQSVVNVFFLLGANWLSRKFGERGIW
ncbi:ABC transporter permease [Butyrivibrio sp. X503]|uniref:ABC transporter permease n=1 Tax=Butyrivibrio sp. X503 TaxID=2364878 RepID=UPI001FA9C53B|nr:ABC transporter permease subunit [Butyrivibrio sp. X503]